MPLYLHHTGMEMIIKTLSYDITNQQFKKNRFRGQWGGGGQRADRQRHPNKNLIIYLCIWGILGQLGKCLTLTPFDLSHNFASWWTKLCDRAKKNRKFHVRMFRILWNVQKSHSEKMTGVCTRARARVCAHKCGCMCAKGRKKACESRFPYCFLTDFTKFFPRGSLKLDFGFLTEEASWIHRIFKISCHDKRNWKLKLV